MKLSFRSLRPALWTFTFSLLCACALPALASNSPNGGSDLEPTDVDDSGGSTSTAAGTVSGATTSSGASSGATVYTGGGSYSSGGTLTLTGSSSYTGTLSGGSTSFNPPRIGSVTYAAADAAEAAISAVDAKTYRAAEFNAWIFPEGGALSIGKDGKAIYNYIDIPWGAQAATRANTTLEFWRGSSVKFTYGGRVRFPNGATVTLANGSTLPLDKDAVVTLADGSAIEFADSGNSVSLTEGCTFTASGSDVTVTIDNGGASIALDGVPPTPEVPGVTGFGASTTTSISGLGAATIANLPGLTLTGSLTALPSGSYVLTNSGIVIVNSGTITAGTTTTTGTTTTSTSTTATGTSTTTSTTNTPVTTTTGAYVIIQWANDAPVPVAATPAPTLTGAVLGLKFKKDGDGGVTRVKAHVELNNLTGAAVRGVTATVYLSEDGTLDTADVKLVTLKLSDYIPKGKIKKNKTVRMPLKQKVPAILANYLDGKYLIVQLAGNGLEADDAQTVVIGPIDLTK